MKILVTGTAGFIGFHLVQQLLARGDEVVGIDNINDYYDVSLKYARLNELGIVKEAIKEQELIHSSLYSKHKFMKVDITNKDAMQTLFETEKFDAVCHLAAQAGVRYSIENPHAYIQSNVVGFLNILEGCRNNNVKNLSYASSSSIYGLNKSQLYKTSDLTEHPVSLYAATKKSNEMMAHTYSHLYGIQTTGLRFFTVYGAWGRPDMAPMLFTKAILENKAIKVFNHGKMSRDFTYVGDIVKGVIKVIDKPAISNRLWNPNSPSIDSSSAPYRIYNIGNNKPTSLMDFIETLEKNLGMKAKKEMLPMQDGDVESTFADTQALIDDFGYTPSSELDYGIAQFVSWYKSFYVSK